MPIQYERVRDFLRLDEGDPPPVFVGRDDILSDILDTAKDKAGRPKVTRIVQGAPGAGKTSILHEMQTRWTGEDGTPRVVTLSSTDLFDNMSGVTASVIAAGTMSKESWRTSLLDWTGKLSGIGAFGFSISRQVTERPESLAAELARHVGTRWPNPVIVAVDESQRFAGHPTTPESRFLQTIHDGSKGLPLMLVLAGLSDTASNAVRMGLTRSVKIHGVGRLEPMDSRVFMERLCEYFGLDASRHIRRLHDLADICDCWPRHLHHAASALASEALRTKGEMARFDWSRVEAETLDSRQFHYESQRSPQMQEASALLAAVMEDIPEVHSVAKGKDGKVTRADVLNCIERHDRPGGPVESRLPDGMTSRDFLNHLIHRGVLFSDAGGFIHSPIPSFRSYLIEAGPNRRLDWS